MPTFMCSLNWTDQGIRSIKDAPKRAKAAQDLAKKVGVEIKQVYLTSGDSDLLVILDTPNGDNVAKFALALGSQGSGAPGPLAFGLRPNFKSSYLSCHSIGDIQRGGGTGEIRIVWELVALDPIVATYDIRSRQELVGTGYRA